MKHTKLKTFLASILVAFNVLVCFAGAYAWFTAAKRNDASGMQIQMYTHELDMSYKVYKYSDDEKSPIDASSQVDALKLQEYDSVIKSRNTNTPVIIVFNITGMTLGENIPVYINTHCTNTTTTARVLSNIIELKFAVISSITSDSATTIYNSAVSYFESVNGVTFKNNNVKNQDILYTLNNYSSSIVGGSLKLYIQLDYSETLIDAFEFSITDSTTTSFSNDLTMINCYTEEE